MKIDSGEFEKLNDGNWEDESSKSLVFPNRTRSRASIGNVKQVY